MDFIFMFFKLIFGLIVVLLAMVLTLKYSNKGITKLTDKKYVKIVDKVQIAKDSYIVIIKLGNKGKVLSVSNSHTEVLEEISLEEILKIEQEKRESIEDMTKTFDKTMNIIKEKSKEIIEKKKLKEIICKKKLKEEDHEKE